MNSPFLTALLLAILREHRPTVFAVAEGRRYDCLLEDLVLRSDRLDVRLQLAVQDGLALLLGQEDRLHQDVHVDALGLQRRRVVIAELDVLVVDLFELHQGQVRSAKPRPKHRRSSACVDPWRAEHAQMMV